MQAGHLIRRHYQTLHSRTIAACWRCTISRAIKMLLIPWLRPPRAPLEWPFALSPKKPLSRIGFKYLTFPPIALGRNDSQLNY